jgi:predicted amidophosphoribosyltransferase
LLDVIVPVRCAACGIEGVPFCEACAKQLVSIAGPLCARCGAPVAWPVDRCAECAGRRLAFWRARAAVAYEGPAVALLRAWKEGGRRDLARLAAALVAASQAPPQVDALTYVPGVRDRELWRGHNPARRLATELGLLWALPVVELLARTRSARRQRGLTRADRRGNVAGAFRALGKPPARVGLVDDVYTSGATVAAAAGALRKAGTRRVEVVTFARTLRDRSAGRGG